MSNPVGWPTGSHPAIPTAPTAGGSPVGWQPPVAEPRVERVPAVGANAVSYTHLTLPTKRIV